MLHVSRLRGGLAELLVAYRFLEAGRLPAWPLVPCAYDVLVDIGGGTARVQVKQAHQVGNRWRTRLGKRKGSTDVPVESRAADYIAVVCTPDEIYVIPAQACLSPTDPRYLNLQIEVGRQGKYQVYRNAFRLGTGHSTETTPPPPVPIYTVPAYMLEKRTGPGPARKLHKRLTLQEIAAIRELPIRWTRDQPKDGTLSVAAVAAQFGVTTVTLRNTVLKRKRRDLA
jgi:hypothetical protein